MAAGHAVASATVKVIPDVSELEPAIMAELDRIGAMIGQPSINDLAIVLSELGVPMPLNAAVDLLRRFVIIKRRETDASES